MNNNWIQIELTTKCNLSCQYCERTIENMASRDIVPAIKSSIMEFLVRNSIEKVLFQGFGETFLCKDFYNFVKELKEKKRDVSVQVVSNGMVNNQYVIDILPEIDVLYVSFDSFDEEYWKNVRCGGNKDIIINNINEFRKINPEMKIVINCVVSEKNIDELELVIDNFEKIGIKDFQLIPEIEIVHFAEASSLEKCITKTIDTLNDNHKDTAIYSSMGHQPKNDCLWYEHGLYVTIDGQVTPCCMQSTEGDDTYIIGNIFDSDIDNKVRDYRLNIDKFKHSVACDACKKILFNEMWNSEPKHPLT